MLSVTTSQWNKPKNQLSVMRYQIRSWEKIAVDLFELNGRDYMITLDYFSSFFEVDSLTTKTADEVIRKLKAHLARHSIPGQLVSDNG